MKTVVLKLPVLVLAAVFFSGCIHDDRRAPIEELIKAPRDESASRKKLLEQSIKYKGVNAIEPLINHLNVRNQQQRVLASQILVQLSPLAYKQIPRLVMALHDSDAQVRKHVRSALMMMDEAPVKALISEVVKKHSNQSIPEQQILFSILSRKFGETPAHAFMKLITNKEIQTPEQGILNALYQPNETLHQLAIQLLPLYRDIWQQAVPLVYLALDSNSEWLLTHAINFLSTSGYKKSQLYDYLVEQSSVFPNRYVRTASYRAFRRLHKTEESLNGFDELIHDDNPYVRSFGLRALWEDKQAKNIPVEKLQMWLRDTDRKPVEKAYLYMMIFSHRNDITPLLGEIAEVLNNKNLLTQIKQQVLLRLPPPTTESVRNFLKTMMDNADDGVAVAAFIRYSNSGNITDKKLIRTLVPYLKHRDKNVVNVAVLGLKALGRKAQPAVPNLVEVLLKNTSEPDRLDRRQVAIVSEALFHIQSKAPIVNRFEFFE